MIKTGIKGQGSLTVRPEHTAKAFGSGDLEVFSTPAMIALMEQTAWASVAPELEAGEGTVGTRLDVAHLAATPVGMRVRCESELIAVDRRKLTFRVEAYDEAGKIGEGTHERFIINSERFMEKANGKR